MGLSSCDRCFEVVLQSSSPNDDFNPSNIEEALEGAGVSGVSILYGVHWSENQVPREFSFEVREEQTVDRICALSGSLTVISTQGNPVDVTFSRAVPGMCLYRREQMRRIPDLLTRLSMVEDDLEGIGAVKDPEDAGGPLMLPGDLVYVKEQDFPASLEELQFLGKKGLVSNLSYLFQKPQEDLALQERLQELNGIRIQLLVELQKLKDSGFEFVIPGIDDA